MDKDSLAVIVMGMFAFSVMSIVLSRTRFKNDSKLTRDFFLWGGVAMAVASLTLVGNDLALDHALRKRRETVLNPN